MRKGNFQKEPCEYCGKPINFGHSITECFKCNVAIHTKCYKKSAFGIVNESTYCNTCAVAIKTVYNPFKTFINTESTECNVDKFYGVELSDIIDDVTKISNVLDRCKSYIDLVELDESIKTNIAQSNNTRSNSGSSNKFSTMFLNIDGNGSNYDTFAVHLQKFEHKFSVIGLAETNTDPCNKNLYPLDGYNSFYQDPTPNKNKGTGVAMYVHNSLKAKVNTSLSHVSQNLETIFLTISLNTETLTVGTIYRPPSGDINAFLEEFQNILENCPRRNTHIMGDFNIDLHTLTDEPSKSFEDLLITSGILPVISLSTHSKPHCRETCIDNIITNEVDTIIMSGTVEETVSHHKPIFHITNIIHSHSNHKQAIAQHYDFSNKKIDMFVRELEYLLEMEQQPTFSDFSNMYKTAIDKIFKLEKPKITRRNNKTNPWITDGIVKSVQTKSELYKKWDKSRSRKLPAGDPRLYKMYSDYRRSLKHLIKSAKANYYGKKFNEYQGDMKKTLSVINELRGKSKPQLKPLFVIDNVKIRNRRIIANKFNEYFVSLASNLNRSIYETGEVGIENFVSFTEFVDKSVSNSIIFLKDCTEDEIHKIISELENVKSSDIPIRVIKRSSKLISPILESHFNNLMQSGIFPDELKRGKITPIYKKDDPEHIENYRPISTLPIFGKILEKIIYERLYSFLMAQKVINPNQFGFRRGHSTSHALNYSVNHIIKAWNEKENVLGIFIDLSKAFDTIDHKKLLTKLDRCGIRGNAHKLINSYLSNRKQYTEVLNEKSDELLVQYGVPQGSVLGPLLFLIYINDITNCSTDGEFVMFADDTNIFVQGKNKQAVFEKANKILDSLYRYMRANLLHVNLKKCCYIYFDSKAQKPQVEDNFELTINGIEIDEVVETKFLGVTVDKTLSWLPHIKNLNKKLKCNTGMLNRIKDKIPNSMHKTLYHTLFESDISYGITVWGGISNNRLKPLFTTQKMCMRIMFGDKNAFLDKFKTSVRTRSLDSQVLGEEFYRKEHTKTLFNKNKILAAQNLYVYHVILNTYKIIKTHIPISLYSCFTRSKRKESLFITPQYSQHFVFRASSLWNEIRNDTRFLLINDFSAGLSQVKSIIRDLLYQKQKLGDQDEWSDENFQKS